MNDQRALVDQLRDLYVLANRNGLYDAADFVRQNIERVERREIVAPEEAVEQVRVPGVEAMTFEHPVDELMGCDGDPLLATGTRSMWVGLFERHTGALREENERLKQAVDGLRVDLQAAVDALRLRSSQLTTAEARVRDSERKT